MGRKRYSPNRDMQELCVEAVRGGWEVTNTGGCHLKMRAPNGAVVFAPSTPSDWRSAIATRVKLRKLWPGSVRGRRQ